MLFRSDQTHVLWGALVVGPDEKDFHNDKTKDYIYNEVAVDYNAAFVGACAGLYQYYGKAMGNKPVENFPPSEASMKGDIQEIYIDARVMQETPFYSFPFHAVFTSFVTFAKKQEKMCIFFPYLIINPEKRNVISCLNCKNICLQDAVSQ